ncbi:hypothetical protein AB0L88_44375 [Saccharopolyspora shandongensis]|uniref:hypothetical protein n=1 Tax=Saccharopolyspora shandongensis TaxID=418495 RepID=UPI003414AF39
MSGLVRWADILCGTCTTDVLESPWTWGQRWRRMRANNWSDCGDCGGRVDSLMVKHGGPFDINTNFGQSPAETRAMNSAHEAGHAVVGLEFDYPMQKAEIPDDTSGDIGGIVNWRFGDSARIYTDQFGAMSLAGTVAQQRWMQEQGRVLTDADRVDLSYGAHGDTAMLADRLGEVPEGSLELAKEMVSDRVTWRQMQRVAKELNESGRLNEGQTRSAMTAAKTQYTALHLTKPASTPAPKPSLATTTTTTTGGTAMAGLDDIRAAISTTNDKSQQIQAALNQVQQWAGEIAGQLGTVLSDSGQVQQVIGAFQELSGQRIDELHQLVSGAVSEIEQYGQRL